MLVRGARVAACFAVCVTVAATFSGCDRLVFGAKAREARIRSAAVSYFRDNWPARSGEAPARASDMVIDRRWISPPLLGTEFFLVMDGRGDHARGSILVALDTRALPHVLTIDRRTSTDPSTDVIDGGIDWPTFSRIAQAELGHVDDSVRAIALARLAVSLVDAVWGWKTVDTDTTLYFPPRAFLRPRTLTAPRVIRRTDSEYDVEVTSIHGSLSGGGGECVVWRVVITRDVLITALGSLSPWDAGAATWRDRR